MRVFVVTCVLAMLLCGSAEARPRTFSTDYFRIEVDGRGYVVGMWNVRRRCWRSTTRR